MARAKRTQRAEARRRNRAAAPDRRVRARRGRAIAIDRHAKPSAEREGPGNAPADGLHGRVPGRHPPAQRPRRPRRAAVDRDPHPRAVGARSRSRWPARSRSSRPMAATSRCSCSPTSSRRRRSAACSSRASSPRGPAGCSARSSASSRRSATPCSSWCIRRRSRAAAPTPSQAQEIALSAFILSPVIGAFFAAGAAWYRRFLRLSSPNRARPAQKSNAKKMGDGRTRGGTTAKASAKR